MTNDWRSGTLLGSAFAFVVQGRVVANATDKEELRQLWLRTTDVHGNAPFPEHLVRQICFVLPPWEKL
jgi:hypothetical protein